MWGKNEKQWKNMMDGNPKNMPVWCQVAACSWQWQEGWAFCWWISEMLGKKNHRSIHLHIHLLMSFLSQNIPRVLNLKFAVCQQRLNPSLKSKNTKANSKNPPVPATFGNLGLLDLSLELLELLLPIAFKGKLKLSCIYLLHHFWRCAILFYPSCLNIDICEPLIHLS